MAKKQALDPRTLRMVDVVERGDSLGIPTSRPKLDLRTLRSTEVPDTIWTRNGQEIKRPEPKGDGLTTEERKAQYKAEMEKARARSRFMLDSLDAAKKKGK